MQTILQLLKTQKAQPTAKCLPSKKLKMKDKSTKYLLELKLIEGKKTSVH